MIKLSSPIIRILCRHGFLSKVLSSALLAVLLLSASGPAHAGLVIVPTFDSTITSDPNAAVIENTINWAIHLYEARFADPITVDITFQEMSSGLGMSDVTYYVVPYSDYYSALQSHATTVNDTNALAHLPGGPNNPITGDANIYVKQANLKALGFTGLAGGADGTISLNTSLMNLTRPGGNPGNYDLMAVAEHEMDEVLGLGSDLPDTSDPFPQDLFRYDSSGSRSFTTVSTVKAFFSLDGTTDLAQCDNQNDGGDFGDWQSNPLPSGVKPKVQDAFGTPGATPNPEVELIVLDVIGYTLRPPPRPVFQTPTRVGSTIHLVWSTLAGLSYQVQYSTNLLQTNWVNLGGTITATNTTASTSDVSGPSPRRFYRVFSLP